MSNKGWLITVIVRSESSADIIVVHVNVQVKTVGRSQGLRHLRVGVDASEELCSVGLCCSLSHKFSLTKALLDRSYLALNALHKALRSADLLDDSWIEHSLTTLHIRGLRLLNLRFVGGREFCN